jgi:uncharacterized membrane protein
VVSKRTLAFVSTLCLLLGALLVGDALHGGVVTNQYAITSPAAVFRLGFGIVLISIGYRFRVPPDDRATVSQGEEQSGAETKGDEAFDPEDSPLDEASMERLAERERDDR